MTGLPPLDGLTLAACCATLGVHLALLYWRDGEPRTMMRPHLRIRFAMRKRWVLDCCRRRLDRPARVIRSDTLIMYRRGWNV